jgi:TolB protein
MSNKLGTKAGLRRRYCVQIFYTVRPGESLSVIAKRWELPVPALIAANNLAPPYIIYPGQQLSVPSGIQSVLVQPGGSVYALSQAYGIPASVIIEANSLEPPYRLQIGQRLDIPPGIPYYTVQPGDTLYALTGRYSVTTGGVRRPELIREANRLTSDTLYPGNRLLIPYAPPGEQGTLAYTAYSSGSYDIWLYDAASGRSAPLTRQAADEFSEPFWSPDGNKIAYIGKQGIVSIVDIAAGTTAQIDQIEPYTLLSWSPGGRELAYMKAGQIVLYDTLSHRASVIPAAGARDPQWFPDGNKLLYMASDSSGFGQLFEIQRDGTARRQLTRFEGGTMNHVRISPDGSRALFTSPGASISIIHTVLLSTGGISILEGGALGKNYYPSWSPDSTALAYVSTVYTARNGYFSQIATDSPVGGARTIRTVSECFAAPVVWSPDGGALAYLAGCSRDQGRPSAIRIVSLRHPVPVPVVAGPGPITALAWSPVSTGIPPYAAYRNEAFHAAFSYPAYWQPVSETRYEGYDGFFEISAIYSENPLHEVCREEAYHKLKPYGTTPRIVSTRISGQEACRIYPSADQAPEMNRQSALLVTYPRPVTINGNMYQTFILWASTPHMDRIIRDFTFIGF